MGFQNSIRLHAVNRFLNLNASARLFRSCRPSTPSTLPFSAGFLLVSILFFFNSIALASPEIGEDDFRISRAGVDGAATRAAIDPAIAYNSTNNQYLVVWTADDATDNEFEIYGQILNAANGQAVRPAFRISNMGPDGDPLYDAFMPRVAYNSVNNEYLVIWAADDNTGSLVDGEFEVYGQRINAANGAEVGVDDFRISDMGPDGSTQFSIPLTELEKPNIDIAYNSTNNEYLVVWVSDDDSGSLVNGEFEVFGQRLEGSSGAEIGTNDFRLSDMGGVGDADFDDISGPRVVYNGLANQYLVAWRGEDNVAPLVDGEKEVFAQLLNAASGAEVGANDFRVSDMGVNGSIFPEARNVALSFSPAHNRYLVVWQGDNSSTSPGIQQFEVYGQFLNSNGSEVGTNDFAISRMGPPGNSSFGGFRPAIEYNSAAGEFWVVWDGDDNTPPLVDSEFEIFLRRLDPSSGDLLGIQRNISDMGPSGTAAFGGLNPEIAFNPNDTQLLAVWFGVDDKAPLDPFEREIFGQRLNAAKDSDGDGVSDDDEIADGTDPNDPGSVLERFGNEICVEWNGFVDFLTQIFELRNTSNSAISLAVTLFDITSVARDTVTFSLAPGIQQDVIINSLSGFETNTYGLVCAKITSGPDDSLGGQLVTYRFSAGSYTLAFGSEFLPGRSGKQYLTYNTFQPSLDPFDQGNFVANWAQIVNDETYSQGGTLRYYDFEGNEIRTESVTLGANERRDVDLHGVGSSLSGMVRWEPNSPLGRFRVRQNRYYYGITGISDLAEALSLPAKRGTGRRLLAPFDTRGRTVALEISNTLDNAVTVSTEVRDANGTLSAQQPPLLGVPARGTRGLVLNEYLANGLGNVQIDADTSNSIIVTIIEYGRSLDGSLLYANPSSPQEALGSDIRGSYNSFLAQACRTRVANSSSVSQSAAVSMTRFDGEVLLDKFGINVPANGALELNLCNNENQEAYGEVKLESAVHGVLVAEVVRQNAAGSIEFGGPLRP